MSAPKPDWVSDYVSYQDIVESWGLEVLEWVVTGSYQGDYVVLLADGDRRGFLVIGYGSCSGCDHLEAISPWWGSSDADWSAVISYAEDLRDEIHWEDTAAEMVNYLAESLAEPDANDWYDFDAEIKQAKRKFITILGE